MVVTHSGIFNQILYIFIIKLRIFFFILSSQNIANLGPATDFYKKMALDFSGQQVAVDTFIISSQYTDIATLGEFNFQFTCLPSPYLLFLALAVGNS